MRGIDVEEATAIGAELLDRDLGGSRTDGDGLPNFRDGCHDRLARGVLQCLAVGIQFRLFVLHRLAEFDGLRRREGLHHALADQHHSQNQRQRQQDVQGRAHQIDPEVADAVRFALDEAAHQGHQHGHTAGGGKEVLHVEAEHLGEITHRRLAAVALPVGVGGKAHRRVEGGIRRDVGQRLRIQRQPEL